MTEQELDDKLGKVFNDLEAVISKIKEKYNTEDLENRLNTLELIQKDKENTIIDELDRRLKLLEDLPSDKKIDNDTILKEIESLKNSLKDIDSKILEEKNTDNINILDKNQSEILNDISEIKKNIESFSKSIGSLSQVNDGKNWSNLKEVENKLSQIEAKIEELTKPNKTINDKIGTLEKKIETTIDAISSKLNYEVKRLDEKGNSKESEINIGRIIKLENDNKTAADTISNLNDENKRINSKIKGINLYKWLIAVLFLLLFLVSSFFYYNCYSKIKELKKEVSSLKDTLEEKISNPTPTSDIPSTTIEPIVKPSGINPKNDSEYVEFAIMYKNEYLEKLKTRLCNGKLEIQIGIPKQNITPTDFLQKIKTGVYDKFKIIHVGNNGNCISGVMFE